MIQWKRVRTGAEWGFFYGIISWILATGVTNKITSPGVWAIILTRTLLGALLAVISWDAAWWLRGLVIGAIYNFILAVIGWLAFGWSLWFWPLVISGPIVGILIEISLRPKLVNSDTE